MSTPAVPSDSSRRGSALPADLIERVEAQLEEVADLSQTFVQSMREGKADPALAEKFVTASKEATRSGGVLELLREADRERQENQTLMEIGMAFSSALSIDELLRMVLDSLQKVVRYDAAGIFLYDRELGQVEIDFVRGYEGADHELLHRKFQQGVKLGEGIVGSVIKSGKPMRVPDVSKYPPYIDGRHGTKSEMAVPILVRNEVIGALNLESDEVDAFSTRDVNSLIIFASHAGLAVERARADRLRMHAKRIEEEIALARRIQSSFLPSQLPSFHPYDLAGINVPSSEVGGDYYDFIPITDTDLGVAIGDVSGHGAGAALLMASFRACLRIESRNNFALRTILLKVNDFIYETNPPDAFVTAVYGVLDRKHDYFSYSNAGHNYPFILRKSGEPEFLEVGGTLLGAFPDVDWEEARVRIEQGELLVLYTDGVTEAMNAQGREFGVPSLVSLVKANRKLRARDLVKLVMDTVLEYRSDDQPQDDLTISVIKHV
ncbi:SpoIIE family protein phosphatase [candidate division KSB1 bacterium]|nr:SpoIIE family protein phosphatase [candidate division KSB1 bacterium]